MRVFMLGWEFPPFISGGLGTACYGLTRGLDRLGVSVFFVLPRGVHGASTSHVEILSPPVRGPGEASAGRRRAARRRASATETTFGPGAPARPFSHVEVHAVEADMRPYARPNEAVDAAGLPIDRADVVAAGRAGEPPGITAMGHAAPAGGSPGPSDHYGGDMFHEIERYAAAASELAWEAEYDFDVVHAHDWMTFKAGKAVAAAAGKPLVVHVHSTEFDRSGLHVNQRIYDVEREGMHAAARVICVSYLTRNIVINRYGVDPRRVTVVYNAIDDNEPAECQLPPIGREERIVLFLGRITMQKGPEYFLGAAKRVLEVMDNVRFIMAGSGDMIRSSIEMAAAMGIGQKVLFTGFLRGADVRRVFRMADLYVMPSVSEPFGITPLEALSNDVPVLISKQSGVAEVLTHALKVDFWDVDEMANKIVAVLRHPPLHATLRDHGSIEVRRLSWRDAAAACVRVYREVTGKAAG